MKTNRELVIAQYPDAICKEYAMQTYVITVPSSKLVLAVFAPTEDAAWGNAIKHINES